MSHELMVGRGRHGSEVFEVGSGSGADGGREWKVEVEAVGGEGEEEVKQCRICHDCGDESEMDAPCACSGSIKFAHKRCIEKWCHIKGDITCEICNQVYSGNYVFPPIRPTSDAVAIEIRAARHRWVHAEYEDYAAATSTRVRCYRYLAGAAMVCFFLHHILVIAKESGLVPEPSEFYNVVLQLSGFILPCYVIVHSCYMVHNHWRHRW